MRKQISHTLDSHVSQQPRVRAAIKLCEKLRAGGWSAYWVGGAVRDLLLHPRRVPDDIDIATDAPFRDICRLLPHTHAIGKAFGVGLATQDEFTFEVATFRKESDYADRRHPNLVGAGTLEEDSERRDFTVNALYFDPIDETITDFHNGVQDLNQCALRCVGDAALRLHEDPLRILRLYRFAANFQFTIEPATERAALNLASELVHVSRERVLLEVSKLHPERLALFGQSLTPFQQTLIGTKPQSADVSTPTDLSSLPINPMSRAFPGTVFALLCAANEGFSSRYWTQTFKDWPLSLEEKAQLELFQRVGSGDFSIPENSIEDAWRRYLETLRWLSRQARVSLAAALWLLKWPQQHPRAADSFLTCLENSLQKSLKEKTVDEHTPLSDCIEFIIRKRAAMLREHLNHALKDEPAKAALGWARLLADSGILLQEIGFQRDNLPTFIQADSDTRIAELISTAMRWSASNSSRRRT